MDRPIRVILDTSAVLRFVRSGEASIGVGETIAEIRDEDAGFGVPLLCLAEAWRTGGEEHPELFEVLARDPALVMLSEPADWRAVAEAVDIAGRADAAVAALLAIDYDVGLLSTMPALYAGFGDPDLVIEV
jgi:hypothetical protein